MFNAVITDTIPAEARAADAPASLPAELQAGHCYTYGGHGRMGTCWVSPAGRLAAKPNGGGQFVNQYTLLLDVMYPAPSSDEWRALFQTDPPVEDAQEGEGIDLPEQEAGSIAMFSDPRNLSENPPWYLINDTRQNFRFMCAAGGEGVESLRWWERFVMENPLPPEGKMA
jgi:hypothetical protein